MVAVAVAAHNVRVAEAEATPDTGTWGNDGGGGGVSDEPDIVYQGSHAQSRKVSTSPIGRNYTHGSGTDMTATDRRHWLAKVNATNSNALLSRASPALYVKQGSGSGAYYGHRLFGNDNYPPRGGWQIVPISPNVSGYRDAGESAGSPTISSILYWSIVADFSASSKSENLVIDAIDIGAGLNLTGGDGADTDGVFQDFIDADQGTVEGGRLGYAYTDEFGKTFFANGRWAIGENTSGTAVATVLQDATAGTIVWGNGYAETGFHRLRLNLGSATTDIDITGWTFDSAGKANNDADRGYTTTEDTRLVLEVTGTAGDAKFIACFFPNLSQAILTAATTLDGCDLTTPDLTQAGAEIFGGTTIRTTSASQVAALDDPTFGTTTDLRDTEFIQEGAGHAIEIDTAGTYDLQDILFTGYGGTPGSNLTPSSGANDAAILNSSGGAVTINVNGGDTPSIRNTASSTTTVVNSVNITLENVVPRSSCAVFAAAGGPETVGTELLNRLAGALDGQMDLPGTNEYVETDAGVATGTGDFEIVFRARIADLTPGANETVVSKWPTGATLRTWLVQTLTTGRLQLTVFDGTDSQSMQSDVHSLTDDTWYWFRIRYDETNGSSVSQAFFWWSADPAYTDVRNISWTAFGTPALGVVQTPQDTPNTNVMIGARAESSPAGFLDGIISYCHFIKNGWLDQGGDIAYLADWRDGPDFTAGSRADDAAAVNWDENGTAPIYTVTTDGAVVDVTGSYAFTSNQPVDIIVRKGSEPVKYRPFETGGTITNTGLTSFVSQEINVIAV